MGKPAFDPSKPFQPVAESKPAFDPNAPHEVVQDPVAPPAPGIAQTALEHGANGLLMGYLPQVEAGVQSLATSKPYLQARDENVKRLAAEQAANPKTAIASTIGGGLAGAVATPELSLMKGAGLLKSIGQGAVYGAGYGALQNPGDVEGKIDPVQLGARVQNAKTGAITGGVTGGVTKTVGSGIEALANASKSARELAQTQAVRSSGAMLKDFRQLNGKGRTNELGQWMLDNGIVNFGDKVGDVAKKSDAIKGTAGKQLDKIYQSGMNLDNAGENLSKMNPELREGLLTKLQSAGFDPARDKEGILNAARNSLGVDVDKNQALGKLGAYLDELASEHQGVLPTKLSNDVKGAMDKKINYSRNPSNPEPTSETAFLAGRREIQKKIENEIDLLGQMRGDPAAAQSLKAANKNYGNASQISQMANDRVARDSANRMISLTDTIAGGAGAGAGALVGGDARERAEHGAEAALAMGLLNHLGRKYGPSTLATGANALQYPLKATQPIAPLGGLINNPAMMRALVNEELMRKRP